MSVSNPSTSTSQGAGSFWQDNQVVHARANFDRSASPTPVVSPAQAGFSGNRMQTSPTASAFQSPEQSYWQGTLDPRSGFNAPGCAEPQYSEDAMCFIRQPYLETRDHMVAGFLALFLGFLGIHKFYLGYNQAGFVMLGACVLGSLVSLGVAWWVVWTISIIESVCYFSKSQTAFDEMYVHRKREWF